ncbi:hypothetical protein IWW37_005920 [Coemansia sp. RSA 2050]|nr:hypothetical protein IWW37_005920 [Coemansia sp. RSA 2050]KAJ2728606.1 hypothetical protein IW152_005925 [Coemansia sp. BCRC 34962]
MPFIHIVLLPVRRDVHKKIVDQVVTQLNELGRHIPFVLSSRCGETVTTRGKQYTHALVVELEKGDQLSAALDGIDGDGEMTQLPHIPGPPMTAIKFAGMTDLVQIDDGLDDNNNNTGSNDNEHSWSVVGQKPSDDKPPVPVVPEPKTADGPSNHSDSVAVDVTPDGMDELLVDSLRQIMVTVLDEAHTTELADKSGRAKVKSDYHHDYSDASSLLFFGQDYAELSEDVVPYLDDCHEEKIAANLMRHQSLLRRNLHRMSLLLVRQPAERPHLAMLDAAVY